MHRSCHRKSRLLLALALLAGCSSPDEPADDRDAVADPHSADQAAPATSPAASTATAESDPDDTPADTARDTPATATVDPPQSSPAWRIPRQPLDLNPERLAAAGIHLLTSPRLILLTDRDPETVRGMLPLANAFFDFLEQNCGALRPSRSGEDFQAIGCLMVDFDRFQSVGLVPGTVVDMRHGQQFGYRFWMRDQTEDYYRRHLLLHEFAHVYMTCDTGLSDIPTAWFMEGAAEVFATHRFSDGTAVFGILPTQFAGMEDWGRISNIRRHRVDRPAESLIQQTIPPLDLVWLARRGLAQDEARYSWWWAFAWMLRSHPAYADDWTAFCHCRGLREFRALADDMEQRHEQRLAADWLLFAESVCEGFDTARSFPRHADSQGRPSDHLSLAADRGWQDTGWVLQAEDTIEITASGQCVIGQTTAPWVAEPNGVTLEYNQGSPLGEVVGVLVDAEDGWMSRRITIGNGRTIAATRSGRLWLQINDAAGAREDNSGAYDVRITHVSAASAE